MQTVPPGAVPSLLARGAGCVLNGPDQCLGPKGLRLESKWVAPETVSLTGHSSSFAYLSLPDVASANGLCLL